MKKWYVSQKKADFAGIAEKFGIDPVVARIIRNRDLVTDEEISAYLSSGEDGLHDPALMLGTDKGAELILTDIEAGKKLRVIGDYDIDGICATFILLQGLKTLGAEVSYDIPDRIGDGYGINMRLIDAAAADGIDTIITCDNGIAAVSEISHAKELGMKVVVTDHHEVPYTLASDGSRTEILPPADVVINPHQKNDRYPFKGLCGALVAFKLIWRLFQVSGRDTGELMEYMDIAALATVGDIMELKGENRSIVKLGLKKFHNCTNMGLNALIKVNELSKRSIDVYRLGFVIGPCMNAGGRLDTAKTVVALLMAEDEFTATALAGELLRLNGIRRKMTEDGVDEAVRIIEEENLSSQKVLVVYLPDSHESIIGIVAGRIKEKYYKPVLVLTDGEGVIKGSGRSIEAYNMFEELSRVKDLFVKFGGHAMAAGLSIEKENIEELRRRLNENATLTEDDLTERIIIDVPMPIYYVNEKLIKQFELLEPFGNGNKKPVFAEKEVEVLEARLVGANKNVLRLKIMDERSGIMDGIKFGETGEFEDLIREKYGEEEAKKLFASRSKKVKINIVYYPTINEFNGRRSIQINIEDYC